MEAGIFSDCIFFLKVNSLSLKEKKKLKNSITLNGGEVSFVLSDKCTHVVVSNPDKLNSSQQKKIEKYLISVVNPDFIWKSVQEEQLGIPVERPDDNTTLEITGDGEQGYKKNQFKERRQKANAKEILDSNLEEDMEFEDSGLDNIPDDTEVAKYCCFKKDKEYAIIELLCFSKQSSFPFRISTTCGIPNTSQKEFTFHLVDTAEKACEKYEHRINDIKNKGFTEINKVPLQAENLASKALQKALLGEAINVTELSPEVAGLVESMWVDAVGHLDAILSCPVENISLNDLSKAEGILRQVRNALVKNDKKEDIDQMMQEFYRCVPHKEKRQNNINMKFLTVKQDLCQVIRDMINVCETSLSKNTATSAAKYQALRCRIEHVDPNSEEFHQVTRGILDHNHSNREFNILRVFRIGRMSEANNFKSDVGNVRPLLHASSPCNFVGILSRGLMLPKIIVEEFGGERTDIGNLGSGIYFSDSISTSVKYSQPSDVTGSRLLVVCDVALGKCRDVFHRDYTITEAPNGFDSVHGVQRKERVTSDFIDDEYVVYDVNQVQMRHVVQFSTDGDYVDLHKESLYISTGQAPDHCMSLPEPSEDVPVDDLPEHQVTKGGLKGSDGQQIPLESIHVKARLKDLAAQVVIFQTYKNNSIFPIEAKYVFPLDSTAAVCGFEAFINGKHIIGEVKEKQKAHQEYRTAISEGHGAYLMDQDAPDVFTVSVGNLPSKATVVIKITYVMELSYKNDRIDFTIPGNVAEWQQDKALKENTQDTVTKVGIGSDMSPGGSFCLDMSIEMPRKIDKITSWTHDIKIKRTECTAVVQTKEASSFNDQGFTLDINMENSYIPRMWVEKHPDQDSEACMLIFQPDIPYSYDDVFLTICLDCSNSMASCFQSAKQVALLALRSLHSRYVNIVLFGSSFKEFYFFPKLNQGDNSEMETFIKKAKPNMGSTEFWKVLQSLYLLKPKVGPHKVLLVSDGHVQNENLVFQILSKHKNDIQLFTCGVGSTGNKHMLRCFAQYGSGTFEYFADKSKSRWADQIENQRNRLNSSACTAVSVKWRQFSRNPSELLQAPANIQALFSEDSVFVYGFVPYCTQATLKALINNEELENMVSTTELQKTTGTMLHTLTARALVKDYEDGILLEKENENEMKKQEMKASIIQLSIEYSIVTQFTSFVAVEKRSTEEDIDNEPNVLEIISTEDVDILPYMDWSSTADIAEHDILHDASRSGSRSSPVTSHSPYGSCDDDMEFALFEDVEESHGGIVGDVTEFHGGSVVTSRRPYGSRDDRMGFDLCELSVKKHREDVAVTSPQTSHKIFGRTTSSRLGRELSVKKHREDVAVTSPQTSHKIFERTTSSRLGRGDVKESHGGSGGDVKESHGGSGYKRTEIIVFEEEAATRFPVEALESVPDEPLGFASGDALSFNLRDRRSTKCRLRKMKCLEKVPLVSVPYEPASLGAMNLQQCYSINEDLSSLSQSDTFGDRVLLNIKEHHLSESYKAAAPSMAPTYMPMSPQAEPAFGDGAVPVPFDFNKLSMRRAQALPQFCPLDAALDATLMSHDVPGTERISLDLDSAAYSADVMLSLDSLSMSMPAPGGSMVGFGLFGQSSSMDTVTQKGVGASSTATFSFGAQSPRVDSAPFAASPPQPRAGFGGSSSLFGTVAQSPRLYSALSAAPPPPLPAGFEASSTAKFSFGAQSPRVDSAPFAASPPQPRAGFRRISLSAALPPPPPAEYRPSALQFSSSAYFSNLANVQIGVPQPPPPMVSEKTPDEIFYRSHFRKAKKTARKFMQSNINQKIRLAPPSWSSLSSLQSQEGFWLLNEELGTVLNINVSYFTADFLVKKGITSLGARGVDSIHKLIATLLVLQLIRAYNILSEIKFKTLMKLDPSIPKSLLHPIIEKAIEWAVKFDRQYPGICIRLGLGKDWDQATRQLLGLDEISTTSDLYSVSEFLFL